MWSGPRIIRFLCRKWLVLVMISGLVVLLSCWHTGENFGSTSKDKVCCSSGLWHLSVFVQFRPVRVFCEDVWEVYIITLKKKKIFSSAEAGSLLRERVWSFILLWKKNRKQFSALHGNVCNYAAAKFINFTGEVWEFVKIYATLCSVCVCMYACVCVGP